MERDAKTSRTEPLKVQIAKAIENQIHAGLLRSGEALPSTRDMAREWSVSVYTVSDAMKILEGKELIKSTDRSRRTVLGTQTRAPLRLAKQHAVFIGGFAGSGKSQFGRILSRMVSWPLLDKDTISRPVVERALLALGSNINDRESDLYLDEVRDLEYEALMDTTVENLELGVNVVVTAPFLRELTDSEWLSRTRDLLSRSNAQIDLVWLDCDRDTMGRYLKQRGAGRDTYKLENWESYSRSLNLDLRPSEAHTIVQNSIGSPALDTQAEDFIRAVLAPSDVAQ